MGLGQPGLAATRASGEWRAIASRIVAFLVSLERYGLRLRCAVLREEREPGRYVFSQKADTNLSRPLGALDHPGHGAVFAVQQIRGS